MRPTAVIMAAGTYADAEIASPLLGADGWSEASPGSDWVRVKDHAGLATTIIWTKHPQRLRLESQWDTVVQSIGSIVADRQS